MSFDLSNKGTNYYEGVTPPTGDFNDLENRPVIGDLELTSETTTAEVLEVLGLSAALVYKGQVDTYDDLPADAKQGDTYNVADTGENYAWNGEDWDKLTGSLATYYKNGVLVDATDGTVKLTTVNVNDNAMSKSIPTNGDGVDTKLVTEKAITSLVNITEDKNFIEKNQTVATNLTKLDESLYTVANVSSDGNYIKAGTDVSGNLSKLDTQVKTNEDDIDTINGNITVTTAGNYISTGADVKDNLSALDTQVKTNEDDIDTINTKITVTTDGSYILSSNDVKDNLSVLDLNVKANEDSISSISSDITVASGTYNYINADRKVNTNLIALDTQVKTNTDNIDTINGKIPSQASADNQLADKDFVNSSIATNTANFIGTFDSVEELNAYSGVLTNNDYAFIKTEQTTNESNEEIGGKFTFTRYKYVASTSSWVVEYTLNNSGFTADQWNAINSGATSENISSISDKANDDTVVHNTGDETINGVKTFIGEKTTFKSQFDIVCGSPAGGLVIGGNAPNSEDPTCSMYDRTSGHRKLARLTFPVKLNGTEVCPNYSGALPSEDERNLTCSFISADTTTVSSLYGSNNNDVNSVEFGGRTGNTTSTSPDVITFTVASAHNSFINKCILEMNNNNILFNVHPRVGNKKVALESTTLAGYGISDAYTKTEVDSKLSSVYKYKGSVETYDDLPTTDLTVGDVYNIEQADETHGIDAGDNVAWTGLAWDKIGGDVDLSAYYTSSEVDDLLDGKADNATSLAGYGITDAYTKTETDTELNKKLSLSGGAMSGAIVLAGGDKNGINLYEDTTFNVWNDEKKEFHKTVLGFLKLNNVPTFTLGRGDTWNTNIRFDEKLFLNGTDINDLFASKSDTYTKSEVNEIDSRFYISKTTAEESAITLSNTTSRYYHECNGDETISFDDSGLTSGKDYRFELIITMGSTLNTVSFPSDITWLTEPQFDINTRVLIAFSNYDGKLIGNMETSWEYTA